MLLLGRDACRSHRMPHGLPESQNIQSWKGLTRSVSPSTGCAQDSPKNHTLCLRVIQTLRELCHTRCCDHQGHQSLVLRGMLLPWQSVKYTVAYSFNQIFIRKLTVFLHCGYFPLNEIVLFVSLFVFKRGNCVLTVLKAAKSPW